MRITALQLQNFKRFTDLQIKNIPAEAKLVLLIGANGSGKSSIFDAFEWMRNSGRFQNTRIDLNTEYFKKKRDKDIVCKFKTANNKAFSWKSSDTKVKNVPFDFFYGRPSLRIVPTIESVRYDEHTFRYNTDAPNRFIEADTKFNLDVLKYTDDINKAVREPLFEGKQADIVKIFREAIEPLNQALERVFGTDPDTTIRLVQFENSTPERPTNLLFRKGNSRVTYDLLGHGEKQVVVILLNFVMRSQYFQDTIYYIDEMDVHLNTALQYELLKEITENWIPHNCQLWTASHSLGFIEYAKDTEHSVILDFDNLNFDDTQILEPLPKFQDEMFEIAVPRASLAKILGNRKIVLCENKNYELYSLMGLDDFIFTDVQNSNSVFLKIKRDKTLIGLRDKDYLTQNERAHLTQKFSNYKILRYYCFENYLYHPDNIAELQLPNFDKETFKSAIIKRKNELIKGIIIPNLIAARNGYEEFKLDVKKEDDLKRITLALESDDFETFYPFFDMKKYFPKDFLKPLNLDKDLGTRQLVKTEWFKTQIFSILQ